MSSAHDARVLTLDRVHNVRDWGGYAGQDGGRVVSGVLWRSAQHDDASDTDLNAIDALNLAHVIDLRGPNERSEELIRRGPAFDATVHAGTVETTGLAPHLKAASEASRDGPVTSDAARARMIDSYRGMPNRAGLVAMLRTFLSLLARGDGPVLVHCVAGKDRTGLAVALAHSILGVHRDDIVDDFLLTNSAGNVEKRLIEGTAMLRRRYPNLSDDAARVLMQVDAAYLDAAFATIIEQHGSVDNYAANVLGCDAEMRDAIRRHHLR